MSIRRQQSELIAQTNGSVKKLDDRNYIVSSQSSNGSYNVQLIGGEELDISSLLESCFDFFATAISGIKKAPTIVAYPPMDIIAIIIATVIVDLPFSEYYKHKAFYQFTSFIDLWFNRKVRNH